MEEFPTPNGDVPNRSSGANKSSKQEIGDPIWTDTEGLSTLRDEYKSVPDRVWVAIGQGKDEDNPLEGKNGRSEWVLFVARELAQAGVDLRIIKGLLLDPEWGISAHVLDQSKDAKKQEDYADRQVWRGDEEAKASAKAALAGKFTGKVDLDRFALLNGQFYDVMTKAIMSSDQINWATHTWPMAGPDGEPIFKPTDRRYWLANRIANVDTRQFAPGKPPIFESESGLKVINTYRRPASPEGSGSAPQPWIDHVVFLYGPTAANVLFDYLARMLQNPGDKVGWSPFLQGPEGCGKDTIFWAIWRFMEQYVNMNCSVKVLEKEHNQGWLYEKLLIIMQENVEHEFQRKMENQEILKPLITNLPPTVPIRGMGKDYFHTPNVANVVFLSNFRNTVVIRKDGRRYYPMFTDQMSHWTDAEREPISSRSGSGCGTRMAGKT